MPRLWLLVALALCGFAANSLLCRMALREAGTIDPVAFTGIRLLSGALILQVLARASSQPSGTRGTWGSALALFTYAIAFSVAYVQLTTGTGALILFGTVQLTMLGAGLRHGERPGPAQWLGTGLAFAGLVVLSWRGVTAPDPLAAGLMCLAGIAWGVYSLRGRGSMHPLADTAGNFFRAVPLGALALLPAWPSLRLSPAGVALATASGALASGVGYSLWYAALPSLTATRAAILQLTVPLLAAAGGIVLLGEHLTLRIAIAALAIVSGVALAAGRKARP